MHSDKPEVWLLASKWENEEQKDVEAARSFLLKGLQRHPDAEVLYMELFKAELLMITFNAESDEEKVGVTIKLEHFILFQKRPTTHRKQNSTKLIEGTGKTLIIIDYYFSQIFSKNLKLKFFIH